MSTAANKEKEERSLTTPEMPLVEEIKTLLTWKSPLRVFKKRDREFWTTVLSIVFLLGIILLFIKEWLLIAVMISLVFLYYVLSTVPPEEVEHQVTNRGVRFAGKDYSWEELGGFWFSEKWGRKIVNIQTKNYFPGRLQILLGELEEKKVKEILGKYLLEEVPQPSFVDKASQWLSDKVPLETRN